MFLEHIFSEKLGGRQTLFLFNPRSVGTVVLTGYHVSSHSGTVKSWLFEQLSSAVVIPEAATFYGTRYAGLLGKYLIATGLIIYGKKVVRFEGQHCLRPARALQVRINIQFPDNIGFSTTNNMSITKCYNLSTIRDNKGDSIPTIHVYSTNWIYLSG